MEFVMDIKDIIKSRNPLKSGRYFNVEKHSNKRTNQDFCVAIPLNRVGISIRIEKWNILFLDYVAIPLNRVGISIN